MWQTIKGVFDKKIEYLKMKFVAFLDTYTDYCWADLFLWAYMNDRILLSDVGKCYRCGYCGKHTVMRQIA